MNTRLILIVILLSFNTTFFSQTLKNRKTSSTNKVLSDKITPDHYIKILWLDEKRFIQLNEDYIKTLTDQQRAALGLTATVVGNECEWDGDKNADESNFKCKFIFALGLGYQCSDKHLSFLKKWFKNDKKSLEDLQHCSKNPSSSSTVQDRFISLKMSTSDGIIKIIYSAVGVDLDNQQQWKWTEEATYSFTKDQIKQINRKNIEGGFY
jgi:hypothetical protein